MKRLAQNESRLRELAENRSLASSQCGDAFLKLVDPLIAGQTLEWERSGGGRRLVVKDAKTFIQFCRQRFPNAALPDDAGSRLTGLARFRDTKSVGNNEGEIISLRVWRDDALLKNGNSVGAMTATTSHGIFSFLLTQDCPYELRGPCALVENPAVFLRFEQLNLGLGAVIYGHGRISGLVLEWLARSGHPNFSLLHLPDYDPTGLSEFQRLHSRMGQRVRLYLPADLESQFARFSNSALLDGANTKTLLAQLRRSTLPGIQYVVGLIDRHNAGLEQEALLIPAGQL